MYLKHILFKYIHALSDISICETLLTIHLLSILSMVLLRKMIFFILFDQN